MRRLMLLVCCLFAATVTWATYVIPFVNADFEETTQNAFARGFDNNGGYDTPGWSDWGTYTDSGVENSSAWWGTYQGYSAFVAPNDKTYNLSAHAITLDDTSFELQFVSKTWSGGNTTDWEITAFYDSPTNVISLYTNTVSSTWTTYTITNIVPTAESIGGNLGFGFKNIGSNMGNLDNMVVKTAADKVIDFGETIPEADAAGLPNAVTLSADVLFIKTDYAAADLYLDGSLTPLSTMVDVGEVTTTVYSADALTFEPNSTHSVSVVAEGTDGTMATNSWEFTMGGRFIISITPEDDEYINVYDPEVKATILDVADQVEMAQLFVNGALVDMSPTDNSGTTMVSTVVGSLTQESNVVCQLIVQSPNGYDPITNDWSFTVAGGVGGSIWDSPPVLGPYDIAQTNIPGSAENNVGYSETQTDRHEWTYISSGDRPAQGQTFTTPEREGGFEVTSVWIKNTTYDDGGSQLGVDTVVKLRITDPSRSNTLNFVRSAQDVTVLNSFANNTGQWIQLRLTDPVVLRANTTYGFDVTAANSWFNTAGVATDDYAGGTAYSSGDNGAGNNSMNLAPSGDRSFIVQLNESDEVFVVNSVAPLGGGILNTPTLDVEMVELGGTLDKELTTLLLDGEPTYTEFIGAGPDYTLHADLLALEPSTTHEGGYIIVSSSPAYAVTNTWTFTMAEGFSFTGQTPPDRSTQTNEIVSLSVQVVEGSDSIKTADLYLDGVALGAATSTEYGTTTVSAVSGILTEGKHKVEVVVDGQYGGEVTKTWEFYLKLPTTDRSWNINIAGQVGGTARNVADGTIAVAAPSGQNLWNNIQGTSGLPGTNNFEVVDTTGHNPIGFYTQGNYNWGNDYTGGTPDMVKEMFKGWFGANANHDAYCTITGLNTSASYDLYLYSTWTWNDNTTKFEIIEGTLEGRTVQSVLVSRSVSVAGAGDDYSTLVEGRNYVVFKNVTPNMDGEITFHSGFNVDCVLSGLQIREHAGEGVLPTGKVLSVSPADTLITTGSATLNAVLLDYNGEVDAEGVVMLLNGAAVDATVQKNSDTTTVSYAATDLPLGLNSVTLIPAEGETNRWQFSVSGQRVVPIELKHHWNFMDGGGSTVKDVEGGMDGTIKGSAYAWIPGGGLELQGGATSGNWNSGSAGGAYVDLPNGLISQFDGDSMTIEAVYVSDTDTAWQRVYSFGISNVGEDRTDGGDECIFLTHRNSGGNIQTTLKQQSEYALSCDGFAVGQLTHIVWEYDSATRWVKMYRNGELVNSRVLENGRPLSELTDVNNWIGRSQWQWDSLFDGKIYDLRIYSGLMTDDETSLRYYTVSGGEAPVALVKSVSPNNATTSEVELEAIIVDFGGSLDPNGVTMLVDGSSVDPTVVKNGTTTTVSYVTSPLSPGKHSAVVFPVEGDTNAWDFIVGYELSVPTTPVYHWDFKDGSGTTVKDIVGDKDGTIMGTNYQWVAGGGLTLLGGGTSSAWNNNPTNYAADLGSYVDLPNDLFTPMSDEVTIEVTYMTSTNTAWQRVYSFGGSAGGETISDSGSNYVFLTSYIGGNARVAARVGSEGEFVLNSDGANIGELNHIVWVYDASQHLAKMYQNGVLVSQTALENAAPLSELYNVNNWIGRSQWPDSMFNGTVKDLRIYNGIMTEAEALARYHDVSGNSGGSGDGPAVSLTAPAGGPLAISWLAAAGNGYNVVTNADLTNPDGWGVVDAAPVLDGDYYTISIEFGEESSLFYKLESSTAE
ncbi:MAG: LamG domain-containing protein [Pontiellaceae bacterium]|nr:LamG domain-containing protein [Pontiellaceae bacterium]